jgi:ribose transport system substrate-binding protein
MTRRRNILKGVGAATSIGVAGCLGQSGDGSGGGTTSNSDGDDGNSGGAEETNFVVSIKGMGQGGLFIQAQAAKWYAQDMPNVNVSIVDGQFDSTEQNQRTLNAMTSETDAVILNPQDAKASEQIIKEGKKKDIPVVNFDTATLSNDIPIGVLFGQYAGGKVVAERFKEKILPTIDADPVNLIAGVFSFESTTSEQRLKGFTENIPDNINVVNTVVSTGTADEAAKPLLNAIRGTDKTIHGIYSNNVGSGLGALTALKQVDRYAKKGEDGHVPAFGIDGGPTLNKRINNGYYDFAVDQPLHMYGPLTMELLFAHLGVDPENSGTRPDSLPKPGDGTIDTDQLSIANKEIFGTEPWGEQFWAPAEMTTYEAEGEEWWPWMRVKHSMITQENADAPYLYGNVLQAYRENK